MNEKKILWNPFKLTSAKRERPDGTVEVREGVTLYVNNHYHVTMKLADKDEGIKGTLLLSIRRNDRAPAHDWRHFQRIKNELVGEEREAVEIYPAESRLVDTSNQFFLFVLPEGEHFPFGQQEREVVAHDDPNRPHNTFQRPFGHEHRIVGQDKCTACDTKYDPRMGCACPPVKVVWGQE